MSPRQRSEDPARNLHSVWLGLKDLVRWWFDATYVEWALGITLTLALAALLWLVLPLGALFLALAYEWGRWGTRAAGDDLLQRWTRAPGRKGIRRGQIAITGIVLLALLLMFSSPATWLLPMHWWLAVPLAVLGAFRAVRWTRPYINANRPVTYWVSALRATANGPRPLRRPEMIIPRTDLEPHRKAIADDVAALAAASHTPPATLSTGGVRIDPSGDATSGVWMKEREETLRAAAERNERLIRDALAHKSLNIIRIEPGSDGWEVLHPAATVSTVHVEPDVKAKITRVHRHRMATLLDALTGGVMLVRYDGHRLPRLRTTTSYLKEMNDVR